MSNKWRASRDRLDTNLADGHEVVIGYPIGPILLKLSQMTNGQCLEVIPLLCTDNLLELGNECFTVSLHAREKRRELLENKETIFHLLRFARSQSLLHSLIQLYISLVYASTLPNKKI